tara:strand:+ start:71 stop:280 length:210 start_codon:yes stop_codon:yes gene_type:complete
MKMKKTDVKKHLGNHHHHSLHFLGLFHIPLIDKDNDKKHCFDMFMIALAIYSTLMGAYNAAFGISYRKY